MPGPSSGYLPPIVATLVGESADLLAKIDETKLALDDLTKTPTDVTITADGARALAVALATRNAIAAQPPITFSIGINSAEALATLATARAIAGVVAASDPITFPVTADVAPLVAGMAVAKTAAAAAGGGSGIIGRLLWGAGGIGGLAAFGSILSLAGFGFEHLMTTALGLAGSLAGALTGGALLAAGALSKLAVGAGSDSLVMSSTIADTKTLYTDYSNLASAIAVYGQNSVQAKAATQQLNADMTILGNTAGVKAEAALARSVVAMNAYWDQATSSARVAAVGILSQGVILAREYIPLVASAAQQNLTIIGNAIKPLMAWLSTTGKTIFGQLEGEFKAELPAAMNAFTQGVELVIRVLAYASTYTGGFITRVSAWLTLWNSAAKTTTWQHYVTVLIGMFHDWLALLKQVGITIFDVFRQSAGLGTSIVTSLTAMLKQLDAWLTSTSGKASLHNLFTVHLQEVQALLALIPSLLGSFGRVYLTVAPELTALAAGLATAVGWMLKIPGAGPILAWALAIGVLAKTTKIFAITAWIAGAIKSIVMFGATLLGLVPAEGAAAVAATGLGVAIDIATGPIGLIVLGAAALVAGLVLLVTHFKQVTAFLHSEWGTAFQIALAVVMPFIGIPLLIITHWNQVVGFFKSLPGWIMAELGKLPGQMGRFFAALPGIMWLALTKGLPLLLGWFAGLLGKILGALGNVALWLLKSGVSIIGGLLLGLVKALPTILAWFIELPFWILSKLLQAGIWLFNTGTHIITGLLEGLAKAAPGIWQWFINLPGWILSHLVTAALWLINTGISVITGFLGGMGKEAPNVWTWFMQLPGKILGFFAGAATWLWNIGSSIIGGLWNGLKSMWNNVISWFKQVGGTIAGFFKNALGIHSPSTVMHEVGQNVMLGLQMGLEHGVGGVMGVMSGMSTQLKNSISPAKLALSGQANATILHSLAAASLPASSTAMGASALPTAGGVAGGNQTMTVPIALNVTVPAGTPSSVAQQIGVATQSAVEKAVYKAVRQMKGGARTYGFMPS
jgi:hypothetical protein